MVKKIAHLADIHIRKLHRFNEYREVFKRLYDKLNYHKPDLIYIGGDVVHGKLDTSPEETRMVADFFLSLCEIAPTIIITGNHDCNLNNKSREDTLSPIVDLVQKINPNLYYWKDSGVYNIDNIDFGVLSIFDIDKDGNQLVNKLPNPNDLKNTKIALYHGSVGTHQYDNGFEVKDDRVTNKTFKGYDLVLLGDIHKRQFLDKEQTIAYPGSLIQQGFAEEPAHGFLLWDIDEKKSKFIQVENNYGFKVIIAPSFADIFRNNCFQNGILSIILDKNEVDHIMGMSLSTKNYELNVDLENEIIYDDSGFKTSFKIDPFRRDSLLKGEDEIARTLTSSDHIDNYEKNRIKRW